MKRIQFLSILLALAMLLTAWIPVCAESTPATLSVVEREITEKDGSLVIRLQSDEAVFGGSFNLVYDSSVLAYEGVSSPGFTCQVNESYAANRIRVSFAGMQGITSGTVVTFSFRPLTSDSCTVSFAFEDVSLYDASGKSVEVVGRGAVCEVTVLKGISSITASPQQVMLGIGEQIQMGYLVTLEDATVERVTWISRQPSTASVNQEGIVTGKRAGTASVECNVRDGLGISHTVSYTVTVYEKPNISISGGYLVPGESITLAVRLDTVGKIYTSGSMNLTYDPSALSLTSATAGKLLSTCMTTVNPAYREDAVRLNFVSQAGVSGSGEICLLTFTALKAGEVTIDAEQILLYTDADVEHTANVGAGAVSVGEYGVSLSRPTAKAWQEFTTTLSFSAAPGVAVGSLILSYDANQLLFLGYTDLLQGFTVTVNESYAAGQIKISFAGTQGVTEGELLTLRFLSKENPEGGIETEIGFVEDSVMLYTQSGAKIMPSASEVSFTVAYDEAPPEVGDADRNGSIDTRDATSLLQYLTGDSNAVPLEIFADLNGDGEVDDADMEYFMKILAGWEPSQITSSAG